MLIAANPAPYISIVIGVCGLGGLIFTALRFRRDDSTAIVQQQSTLVNDMELIVNRLREENDRLVAEVKKLAVQIRRLSERPG